MRGNTGKALSLLLNLVLLFILVARIDKPLYKNTVSPKGNPPNVTSAIISPQVKGTKSEILESVKVLRVIDGDTVEIEGNKKLRLIGIDTPEMTSKDCFAQESKNYLVGLVEGKTVQLEKDISEVDRYGRLLRYVYLEGVSINEKLVSDGYAKAYTYPPDVKNSASIVEAEKLARSQNRGLWGFCKT